jgi:hypothetical protein
MKKLDLNAYGVVEMSNAEMREIDGGFTIFKLSGFLTGGPLELIVLGIKLI